MHTSYYLVTSIPSSTEAMTQLCVGSCPFKSFRLFPESLGEVRCQNRCCKEGSDRIFADIYHFSG